MSDNWTSIPTQEGEDQSVDSGTCPSGRRANKKEERPSLIKQIMGAVVGGGLALSLYYGYEFAKPRVTAYLSLPALEEQGVNVNASRISDTTMDEGKFRRIQSRARQIAEDFSQLAPEPEDFAVPESFEAFPTNVMPEEDSIWDDPPTGVVAETPPTNFVPPTNMVEQPDNEDLSDIVVAPEEVQSATERLADMYAKAVEDDTAAVENTWVPPTPADEVAPVASVTSVPATQLPNSGVGLWVAFAGAFGGAMGARVKRRK